MRVPDPDDPDLLGVATAQYRQRGPERELIVGVTTGISDFESDLLVSAFAYVFFRSS